MTLLLDLLLNDSGIADFIELLEQTPVEEAVMVAKLALPILGDKENYKFDCLQYYNYLNRL